MAMMARNIARLTAAPRHRVATYAVMPEAAVEIVPPRAMAPLKAKLSARPAPLTTCGSSGNLVVPEGSRQRTLTQASDVP